MKSYASWTKRLKAITSLLWILLGLAFIVGVIWFVRLLWTANQIQEESDVSTESSETMDTRTDIGSWVPVLAAPRRSAAKYHPRPSPRGVTGETSPAQGNTSRHTHAINFNRKRGLLR